MGALAPQQFFQLFFDVLRDIASAPEKTPTLYQPSRSPMEYNFVQEGSYFDQLVPVVRSHVVEVLRSWIHPDNHINVRFLASDFVGKYQLQELAHELKVRPDKKLQQWETVPPHERDCVLNFRWAASRCEKQRYASLGRLLITTPEEYIQKWILWVPRQMPDKEFVRIVKDYLARNKHITREGLNAAILALAALKSAGHSVDEVLRANPITLGSEESKKQLELAWRSYQLDPTEALVVFDHR
jgi:hypothetical protein